MARPVTIFAVVGLLSACAGPTAESSGPPVSASAVLAAGERHLIPIASAPAFSSLIGGKVVVIDFWASWCEGCRDGFPKLERLAQAYATSDLVVLGVNVGEDAEVSARFLNNLSLSYPQFRDPGLDFADSLGSRALPALYVLDREGRVVAQGQGLSHELLAKIRGLLDQGAQAGR